MKLEWKCNLMSAVLHTAAGEDHKTWSLPWDRWEAVYCSCCWCLWRGFGTFQFWKKKKKNNWQIPKSGTLLRKHNKSDGGSEREGQIRGTWKHNNTERERERKRGRNTQTTVTNRATRTYVQEENELEKRYWQAQISIHSLAWGYMDPIKV